MCWGGCCLTVRLVQPAPSPPFVPGIVQGRDLLLTLLPNGIGLHFSDAAYALWRDELVSAIAKHYPDLTPERMPFVFEAWDTLLGVQR